ncbi:MAG: 2'-5' RNA ligase family protein [Pseudomonadota bacterium]
MEQSSLFGDAPPANLKRPAVPRKGRYRLFFALFPAQAAVAQLLEIGSSLGGQFGLTGRLHAGDRLHMTLDHIGDFDSKPEAIIQAACDAASEVQARTSGFPVSLNRVLSFGRNADKHPLVLKDSTAANLKLKEFRADLWDALAARNVPGASRNSFTPHVTLLYEAHVVPEHPVDAVSWSATEFVLLHSAMMETRYEVLGRWQLQAPD